MMSQLIRWIFNNKLLSFFGVATLCFFVSTVALTVKNNELKRSMIIPTPKADMQGLKGVVSKQSDIESNRYRLPKYIEPTNYILRLYPNLVTKVFEGKAKITLNISKSVKEINLHAKDLNIHCVELKSNSNQNIHVVSTKLITTSEILQVVLQDEIDKDAGYELQITFTGKLDKGIVGFYASTMRNGQ